MITSLTILMPCLNEVNTLGVCVGKAKKALQAAGINQYEIIIADNGSTDGSIALAEALQVRVVPVTKKGYGAALHAGIQAAASEWVIFADADDSYHFENIDRFIPLLSEPYDFIMGNRFGGTIHAGAMPKLHRYLGTPIISWLGRKAFAVPATDFNCGMRAIRKASYAKLNMQSPGMEYASEMIAKAGLKKLRFAQVPVDLHKDGRDRKPHLRTWQDGWKHLRLILLLSPRWLLLVPAIFFLLLGCVLAALLVFNYVKIANLVLDIHTLFFAAVFIMVGFQLWQFYVLAAMQAYRAGLNPGWQRQQSILRWFQFERSLLLGSAMVLLGMVLTLFAIWQWKQLGFGPLNPVKMFRIIIPAGFFISVGMQYMVFGFLLFTLQQFEQPLSISTQDE